MANPEHLRVCVNCEASWIEHVRERACGQYLPVCGQRPSEWESFSQRQDSLVAQMQTVMKLAVSAGCYDAHDWLIRNFGCESCNGCEVDMCHACGRGTADA